MKYNTIINTQTTIILICLSILEAFIEGTGSETFLTGLMCTICLITYDIIQLLFTLLKKTGFHVQRWQKTSQMLASIAVLLVFAIIYRGNLIMWIACGIMLLPLIALVNIVRARRTSKV